MSSVIIGTGSDLPEWVLTNDDIEAMGVGYDRARAGVSLHEWVMKRHGVRERHRVRPGEAASDLGTRAAQRALDDAGLGAGDLDLLVLSTYSSDYRVPSAAALVQANLGTRCKFFQIDAACAGHVDSLIAASALMDYMDLRTALVISAEAHTIYFAPDDFMGLSVFGDGAGAVILRREADSPYGIRSHCTYGDGSLGRLTWVPGGGSKEPFDEAMLKSRRHYGVWAHREVYAMAVKNMADAAQTAAARAGWELDQVDWFIPHQAGRNIITDVAARLQQPLEKFALVIDHTGNTSGASIPIALDETNRAGKLKDGQRLVLPAIGAGLAWGALGVVWHDYRAARGANGGVEPHGR